MRPPGAGPVRHDGINHEAPVLRPLSGRPAGISFSQVASARRYCGLFVSIGVVLLNVTLLLRRSGPETWEIHASACRRRP